MTAKTTLACCLVVRNESSKIVACLQRLVPLAEQVVVVDTGSTDDTKAKAESYANRYLKGRLKYISVGTKFHDADGDFHFGNAKEFALKSADTTHVMWLDANDLIVDPVKVRKIFVDTTMKNPNVYFVFPTKLSDKFSFARVRCAPKDGCQMVGRVHEYMNLTKKLDRIFVRVHIENKKVGRDLDRNLKLLNKDWLDVKTSRTAFYMAQTYMEQNDKVNALKWFKIRVDEFDYAKEYPEEVFKSIESICDILMSGKIEGWDIADLKKYAEKMIELEPTRLEGYFYLGRFHMIKRQYQDALIHFRQCERCKIPKKYNLWINRQIYDGHALQNAIEFCEVALKHNTPLIPDEIFDLGGRKEESTYRMGNAQYEAI